MLDVDESSMGGSNGGSIRLGYGDAIGSGLFVTAVGLGTEEMACGARV